MFPLQSSHSNHCSIDSSNVSKYFVSNQSQSTLKSEEGHDKHWKSTTMQEEGETDVNNDDDDHDHNFFLAEPKPTSHSKMSQKEMLSPLPPVRTISNKPLPSNQPRIAPSTTDNSNAVSSKFQARMLVASPLSDWLQLGLNLDLPNPTPSSSRQVDTGDLPSTASTIHDPARFSRQSSGFLLEPIGSKGGVAGGEPHSHPLNHNNNHHPRGVHTTSHLHHGNQKFFESSLPTRDKDGAHIMSSMELLKQFPNSDALHKAKKSLLILNEQIQQLHSPKSSHSQNHFHPNHATSPHQINPESSPSDSPLHNIPLGPKISATSSYSAPPSTRNSHPGPFISTKTTTDELSALLESHDSLDEPQSHHHPTANGVMRKSSFSSKKDFVSASVDEAMLIGKSDSTSSASPQSALLGGVSAKGAGAYLVSQSLNEADHQRSTPRVMGGAGGRLFEYTNDGKGSNILQSQRSLAVNGAVAHPSPRMIGSTSVSRLKAGGLSLMRDNSNRSLVVEDVVSTKNAKKAPYDFHTPAVTPSAATSTGSEKARVAALAAALDAGDAVGKLMAEMFSTSKKNK